MCKKGDRVIYIPAYACRDPYHPDCERGVVSSLRDGIVFVKYDNAVMKMITGEEPYTAQATRFEDLILESPA